MITRVPSPGMKDKKLGLTLASLLLICSPFVYSSCRTKSSTPAPKASPIVPSKAAEIATCVPLALADLVPNQKSIFAEKLQSTMPEVSSTAYGTLKLTFSSSVPEASSLPKGESADDYIPDYGHYKICPKGTKSPKDCIVGNSYTFSEEILGLPSWKHGEVLLTVETSVCAAAKRRKSQTECGAAKSTIHKHETNGNTGPELEAVLKKIKENEKERANLALKDMDSAAQKLQAANLSPSNNVEEFLNASARMNPHYLAAALSSDKVMGPLSELQNESQSAYQSQAALGLADATSKPCITPTTSVGTLTQTVTQTGPTQTVTVVQTTVQTLSNSTVQTLTVTNTVTNATIPSFDVQPGGAVQKVQITSASAQNICLSAASPAVGCSNAANQQYSFFMIDNKGNYSIKQDGKCLQAPTAGGALSLAACPSGTPTGDFVFEITTSRQNVLFANIKSGSNCLSLPDPKTAFTMASCDEGMGNSYRLTFQSGFAAHVTKKDRDTRTAYTWLKETAGGGPILLAGVLMTATGALLLGIKKDIFVDLPKTGVTGAGAPVTPPPVAGASESLDDVKSKLATKVDAEVKRPEVSDAKASLKMEAPLSRKIAGTLLVGFGIASMIAGSAMLGVYYHEDKAIGLSDNESNYREFSEEAGRINTRYNALRNRGLELRQEFDSLVGEEL